MAEKRAISYEQVHEIVRNAVQLDIFRGWKPTLIVCIAAGGFVPTRILRSFLKHKHGHNIPIQTIGLQLYDVEDIDPATGPVQRTQWLCYGTGPGEVQLQGQRILLVDEVDDSRKTLACAVSELLTDVEAERQQHERQQPGKPWQQPELGVFVLHNKLRPKLAEIPAEVYPHRYFAGLEIENCWCVYPWDALMIYDHTETAEAAGLPLAPGLQERSKRQSSGCPSQQQMAANGHHKQQQQLPPSGSAAPAANGSSSNTANGANGVNGGVHAPAANGLLPVC